MTKERLALRKAADPEHYRARDRAYRATRRDKERARVKVWRAAHPEKVLKQNRRRVFRKYGLTPERYDAMLTAQGGRCAICHTDTPGPRREYFYVDHDHWSGLVRGLLCHLCNVGLGSFRDEPFFLSRARDYVCDGVQRAVDAMAAAR
jgi:hypothetical protein